MKRASQRQGFTVLCVSKFLARQLDQGYFNARTVTQACVCTTHKVSLFQTALATWHGVTLQTAFHFLSRTEPALKYIQNHVGACLKITDTVLRNCYKGLFAPLIR